ncbi:MAG: (Fe-S)-binding protein, partial [Oscillospiraceae bacterium]|nr:(Fe-S)-binding protein [Oscillospiraceae bacterium]
EKKIFNQVHTWEPRRPRYNGAHGVYDAPRALIAATGANLLEMERIREYSWCCGAGGGCSEVDVKLSDFAANERIEEAKASGAACLITACPWCRTNFKKAGGMEVKDILDLACEAL